MRRRSRSCARSCKRVGRSATCATACYVRHAPQPARGGWIEVHVRPDGVHVLALPDGKSTLVAWDRDAVDDDIAALLGLERVSDWPASLVALGRLGA